MNDSFEYFLALAISVGLSLLVGKILDERKILYSLDKPYWVVLFAILFTYMLYGTMYIEDQLFSLITQTDPSFTGCSGVFTLPPGLEKCFYLIPKTKAEIMMMLGKLLSSIIICLFIYFRYIKK